MWTIWPAAPSCPITSISPAFTVLKFATASTPGIIRISSTRNEVIDCVAEAMNAGFGSLPGVRLEHKGVSLTVHVRAVESTRRKDVLHTAIDLARPWLDSDELKVLDASEAIELLPNIAWNKGDAVRWIVDDVEAHARQKAWCIFFGDDVTDEDAFRAVRDGLTVVVGQRPSLARLRLNSQLTSQLSSWA